MALNFADGTRSLRLFHWLKILHGALHLFYFPVLALSMHLAALPIDIHSFANFEDVIGQFVNKILLDSSAISPKVLLLAVLAKQYDEFLG